jgi:hypothetical protein
VAILQGTLILVICLIAGFRPHSWLAIPAAFLFVILIAIVFAALGTAIGSVLKDMQGFQLIMNFLVMPIFFLSGALFPLANLPAAMTVITRIDPLSYGVDGLRGSLIRAWQFSGVVDVAVLAGIAVVLLSTGAYLFSKIEVKRPGVLDGRNVQASLLRGAGRLQVGSVHAGFGEAIDQVLYKIGLPPYRQLATTRGWKVGPLGQEDREGLASRFHIPELRAGRRHRQVRAPKPRHVDFLGDLQSEAVLALAVSIETGNKPVPGRMIRVETARPRGQCAAAFPVAGIGCEKAQVGEGEPIHGIEFYGAMDGDSE